MRPLATFPSYNLRYNCFGVSEVIAAREACIHPVLCTVVRSRMFCHTRCLDFVFIFKRAERRRWAAMACDAFKRRRDLEERCFIERARKEF